MTNCLLLRGGSDNHGYCLHSAHNSTAEQAGAQVKGLSGKFYKSTPMNVVSHVIDRYKQPVCIKLYLRVYSIHKLLHLSYNKLNQESLMSEE